MYGFVYETTNLVNGKKYIGQKNYDSEGKWKRYLGSGIVLTKAIKKYGKENFSRVILEECETEEELNEKEKQWIKYFNATQSDMYYNIAAGGDGGNVMSGYSEEQLADFQRRIESINNARLVGEDSPNAVLTEKQVIEIIDRLKANEFPSDIANSYNVAIATITAIRYHRAWTHLTADIHFDDVSKRKRPVTKRVVQYDRLGNLINEYSSAREAEKETGIGYRLISAVCHGDKKSAHGFIWKFKDDVSDKNGAKSFVRKKVNQYDENCTFIKTWSTANAIKRELGIQIGAVLRGNCKTAGGYLWAYCEK